MHTWRPRIRVDWRTRRDVGIHSLRIQVHLLWHMLRLWVDAPVQFAGFNVVRFVPDMQHTACLVFSSSILILISSQLPFRFSLSRFMSSETDRVHGLLCLLYLPFLLLPYRYPFCCFFLSLIFIMSCLCYRSLSRNTRDARLGQIRLYHILEFESAS